MLIYFMSLSLEYVVQAEVADCYETRKVTQPCRQHVIWKQQARNRSSHQIGQSSCWIEALDVLLL